jgi:hypothetical protein
MSTLRFFLLSILLSGTLAACGDSDSGPNIGGFQDSGYRN